MDRSDTLTSLLKALVEAKKKFKPISHNCKARIPTKDGSFKEYSYASLDLIIEKTEEALLANGLTMSHSIDKRDNVWSISTILFHVSGEFLRVNIVKNNEMEVKGKDGSFFKKDMDFHAIGSMITYFKRYGYAAILGLSTDQDEDGHEANDSEKKCNDEPYRGLPAAIEEKPKVNSKEIEDKFWSMIPSGLSHIQICNFVDKKAVVWQCSDVEVKSIAIGNPGGFLKEFQEYLKNT